FVHVFLPRWQTYPSPRGMRGHASRRQGAGTELVASPELACLQNAGQAPPRRTLRLSATSAGAMRTWGRLGQAPPSRTLRLSETSAGICVLIVTSLEKLLIIASIVSRVR